MRLPRKPIPILILLWAACLARGVGAQAAPDISAKASAAVIERLASTGSENLIVQFNDQLVQRKASQMRSAAQPFDTRAILRYKAAQYAQTKRQVLSTFSSQELTEYKQYSQLPMAAVRVHSRAALNRLLADPRVAHVYRDRILHLSSSPNLSLIGQPQAAASGDSGTGTTVAVIDTGVDYTLPAFGSCTSPGVPAGCKVVFFGHFEPHPVSLDPNGHGTNVAGIVLDVAPGAKIAALDVFDGDTALTSDVIDAGNWVIAHQATYNIVAMNLSLGSGRYTAPETNGPFNTLVDAARAAGILTVAAAGNDGYTDALSSPAATSGVVSVGAVYDSASGVVSYPAVPCTDVSAVDKVACFSDSASFLTLLAPGVEITAAGITDSGTSQATPHVSGAVAVLRAAYPSETLDQTVARLTDGESVTDSRNGIVKPRLSLPLALGLPPPCNYALSSTAASYNASTASSSLAVTAGTGCAWSASANVSWITLGSGNSGTGDGSFAYTVAANTASTARSGTITVGGISFSVSQAGSAVFPPGGVVPVGWTTSAGANAGWNVASDAAFEGSYSLKSAPIGNGQKAQIEVTGNFTAGDVSFAEKVSSEANYDFLRFYIDGVQQAQWSGQQGWAISSFALSAGVHTLRWSYEKDASVSIGSDAAWIDAVSLPPRVTAYAYNIPAPSNPDQPYIRIYNTSNVAGAARVTLYDQNGQVLGNADSTLIASMPPNAVGVFSAADIATAVGVSGWTGRAWMKVQPDFASNSIANLIRSGRLLDMSCVDNQYAYYLPPPGDSEQPYLRLYNTSGTAGTVRGTLYDGNGNVLGTADATLVANLPADGVAVLNSSDIAQAVGVSGWTGVAWMHLTSDFSGLQTMNTLRDMTTNTLIDASCSAGGTSADAYNIPPPSSPIVASLRIYNTTNNPMTLSATLRGEDGDVLGTANASLGTVGPDAVRVFDQNAIANLVGASGWTGRAWIEIDANASGMRMVAFTNKTTPMNMSCSDGTYAFNIPNTSNRIDQPLIRIYNTSSTAGNVYGTLYDMNGNVLGNANAVIYPNLPAGSVAIFSAASLASAIGSPPWTGRAWLKLTSDFSGLKVVNILQDMASVSWANMSCQTN